MLWKSNKNEWKKKKQLNTERLHKCAEPKYETEDVYIGLMFEQKESSLFKICC